MILSPLETVLLWLFIIFYSLVLLIAWRIYRNSNKGRKRSISYLFLLNLAVYVLTIEVPGFLILSRYDEKSINVVQTARGHLIRSTFEFTPSIQGLQALVKNYRSRLEELHLYANLDYFIQSSSQMNQINRSVFDLLLMETGQSAGSVSQRSKHPFPKLIDVLSLAGLSFLIAQLLG